MIVCIILAGGSGTRFGTYKQFITVAEKPIFIHTLEKYNDFESLLVYPSKCKSIIQKTLNMWNLDISKKIHLVTGGSSRVKSVRNALQYIKDNIPSCTHVLIADACRPCIKKETVKLFANEILKNDSVVAVCKSINTTAISSDALYLFKPLDRSFSYELLMPQCFRFFDLYQAHMIFDNDTATDDTFILKSFPGNEKLKIKIQMISFWEGLKLTYKEDIPIIDFILRNL